MGLQAVCKPEMWILFKEYSKPFSKSVSAGITKLVSQYSLKRIHISGLQTAWRYPIWTLLGCLVMLLASAQACALSIQSSRSSWEIESTSCSGLRSVAMNILLGGSE